MTWYLNNLLPWYLNSLLPSFLHWISVLSNFSFSSHYTSKPPESLKIISKVQGPLSPLFRFNWPRAFLKLPKWEWNAARVENHNYIRLLTTLNKALSYLDAFLSFSPSNGFVPHTKLSKSNQALSLISNLTSFTSLTK